MQNNNFTNMTVTKTINSPYVISEEQAQAIRAASKPDMKMIKEYASLFKCKPKGEKKMRNNSININTSDLSKCDITVNGEKSMQYTLAASVPTIPRIPVDVKILDDKAVLPTYGTSGAAGFDFYAIGNYVVDPGKTVVVKTGLAMAVPQGYYLAVVPRSGVSVKTGIRVANAPGTVDADYRGEIGIIVSNTSNDTFTIDEGYRIAQGIILPYYQASFNVVDKLDETARGTGGYGSTGVK